MRTHTEPAREIPITRDVDVVVAGGSPTGVAAAVAAARNGAKVLIIERNICLGGQAQLGAGFHSHYLYNASGQRIVAGLMQEIAERSGGLRFGLEPQAAFDRWASDDGRVPGEYLKAVLRKMVEDAGVEVIYGAITCGARVENGAVTGAIIEGRAGRALVGCRCAIDATGDGELAARAGAQFRIAPSGRFWRMMITGLMHRVDIGKLIELVGNGVDAQTAVIGGEETTLDTGEVERLLSQGTGVCLSWHSLLRKAIAEGAPNPYTPGTQERLRFDTWSQEQFRPHFYPRSLDGIVHGPSSAVEGRNPVDNDDFSRSIGLMNNGIQSQLEWYRAYVPGFANAELLSTSPIVLITESRRIVGEYTLMAADVLESRHFEDCIGKSAGHDRHSDIPKGEHEIPYRCLVPESVDGLLVAGRCISADREQGWTAFDAIRGMISGVVTGQAAGTAAALAVSGNITPRALNIRQLQEALLAQNVIL